MPRTAFVLLTSAPGGRVLTETLMEQVRNALERRALVGPRAPGEARWLSPGDAFEVQVAAEGRDLFAVRAAVEDVVGTLPVDVNIVPVGEGARRKKLMCADMESTIIRQELIDEMAELAGRRSEIAAVTASAMRGEIDFAESLRRRVSALRGVRAEQLDAIRERITLMPGAETLVRTMSAQGAACALVSGGFTLFADEIGRRLGFDVVVANDLVIEDGTLTGDVREPIVGPDGKADALAGIAAERGIALSDTIAVGDGANDVAMLEAAGLGVAFRAKPLLIERARALERGAVVAHGDLSALLHLQGYDRGAFAA